MEHRTRWMAAATLAAALLLPFQAPAAPKAAPPPAPAGDASEAEELAAPMPPPPELREGIRKYKDESWEPATLDFYAVLDDPRAAEYHDEAGFFLARCLERMGMPYAALLEYARFLAIGGDSEKFIEGFQSAVKLGEELDAGWLLAPSLTVHSDDRYARDGSGTARYWVGRAFYQEGKLDEARAYLMAVDKASPVYSRARFLEGVVLTRLRRPKDAVQPFQEALRVASKEKGGDGLAILANLNLARTWYALGNFERAFEHYKDVPRDHVDWYESLFERAWSQYMLGRLDGSLAELQSVTAPFFDGLFIPEPLLLKALVYYQLCKYQDGKKLLDAFTADYKPIFDDLGRAVEQGQADRDRLFESVARFMLDGDRAGVPIPHSVLLYFERDESLRQAGAFVRGVRNEGERMKRLKSGWGDQPVARDLRRRLDERASELKAQKSGMVLARLRGLVGQLSEFMTQAEIYKLEMLTREKDLYTAASRGDVMDRLRARRSVEVPKGYNYWPFEGEYWIDEIGWYQITTVDECKEVLRQ